MNVVFVKPGEGFYCDICGCYFGPFSRVVKDGYNTYCLSCAIRHGCMHNTEYEEEIEGDEC